MHRHILSALCGIAALTVALSAAPAFAEDPLQRLQQLGQQGGGATGQTNDPLDRLQQLGQGQADPLGGARQPIRVPDWVTPGTRIAFRGSITTEPPANRKPDDPPAVTAAAGVHVLTVLAVTDTFVLVQNDNYFQVDANPNHLDISPGGGTQILTADVISVGNGFFMHPDELTALQPSPPAIEVVRGPFPINNHPVESVTITVRGQNVVMRRVYDAASGLKLAEHNASGPLRQGEMHNEMNRHTNDLTQFLGIRRLEGPWLNQTWPAWTANVRQLQYQGQIVHSMQGISNAMNIELTTEITDRGDGWWIGKQITRVQPQAGMPPMPPNEAVVGQSTNMLGGMWMSPQALAAIQPGVIDRDPHTGAVTSYQRGNGQGTFILQANAGSRVITVYSLEDGVLQGLRVESPRMFQTMELRLTGRR